MNAFKQKMPDCPDLVPGTGPIVAFLDDAHAAHHGIVRAFERFTGRFVTPDG